MSETTPVAKNVVKFFEISTDDRATIESFYGDIFGWQFMQLPQLNYSFISIPGHGDFQGGVYDNRGEEPNWGIFCIEVDINEMDEICRKAEAAGGTVTYPPTVESAFGEKTTAAQILDPSGNRFGIYAYQPAPDSES
ncbi:VOC family protein [Kibdelosporangium persicum]|uniref:Glyoxalase n=1 Tax=Kibdelosporangium persicum TaxID=2698649 RepID=A0ABX2FJ67_9PSEU|nr:VOC family protein [Kibdelosporangium persicum]NRN71451.1 Glyoxalase [Kibdelosporangium persicum]